MKSMPNKVMRFYRGRCDMSAANDPLADERDEAFPVVVAEPRRTDDFTRHGRIATHWARILRSHPGALSVAVMLSSYARTENGQRKCWPNQKTLAKELGVTPRAVGRHFETLRRVHFILGATRRFQKSSYVYIDDYEPKVNSER
jgi:hypothetical protein